MFTLVSVCSLTVIRGVVTQLRNLGPEVLVSQHWLFQEAEHGGEQILVADVLGVVQEIQ